MIQDIYPSDVYIIIQVLWIGTGGLISLFGLKKMDVGELIGEGESEAVELKPTLSQINDIVESVSAFSNKKGGRILVGVSNSGKILGVEVGKDTIEKLTNKIRDNTEPVVYPSISVVDASGKEVIVIEIKESLDKPVLAFGRPFKRVGRSSLRMAKDEYERTIVGKHREELRFDNRICEEAGLEDIDEGKVRWFVREARRKRGLAVEDGTLVNDALAKLNLLGNNKLTNAAILLFGKDPQQFFMQSEVKCIALPTTEFVKPYDTYQAYEGNLFEQVDKSTAFVLENIRRPLWVEPGEIAARHPYELPREAVREAIVNAIIHRDYNSPSKVQVRLFPDRVEIWNPGQLPPQLEIGDLKKPHPSIPHNPLLFRQFYRAAFVEDAGGGIIDIISRCNDIGLPEPSFKQTMGSFITTIWRSVLVDEYLSGLGLNDRQRRSIGYAEQHKRITNREYRDLFGVGRDTAHRDLTELVEKGVFRIFGRGRSTYYTLKLPWMISDENRMISDENRMISDENRMIRKRETGK